MPRCDVPECGSAVVQLDQEFNGGKGTCGRTVSGPHWQGCECVVQIFDRDYPEHLNKA